MNLRRSIVAGAGKDVLQAVIEADRRRVHDVPVGDVTAKYPRHVERLVTNELKRPVRRSFHDFLKGRAKPRVEAASNGPRTSRFEVHPHYVGLPSSVSGAGRNHHGTNQLYRISLSGAFLEAAGGDYRLERLVWQDRLKDLLSHQDGKLFKWTKTADEILEKLRRFGPRTLQVHGE